MGTHTSQHTDPYGPIHADTDRPGCILAIEGGGTKFVCALMTQTGTVLDQIRIPTSMPDETLGRIATWFQTAQSRFGPVSAAGIGCFGAMDLDLISPGYGALTSSAKKGWSQYDLLGQMQTMLNMPIQIDTDVNCAARGESVAGAGKGLRRICYITVGTGIGVGLYTDGDTGRGVTHPEIGHSRVPRYEGDSYAGLCPYHKDCVEGLASGPAIEARWQIESATDLPPEHPAWDMEAYYIGVLCTNVSYAIRPERIIIGGGVFSGAIDLYPRVRQAYRRLMAGFALTEQEQHTDGFIVPPGLQDVAPGLLGAFELGKRALEAGSGR